MQPEHLPATLPSHAKSKDTILEQRAYTGNTVLPYSSLMT